MARNQHLPGYAAPASQTALGNRAPSAGSTPCAAVTDLRIGRPPGRPPPESRPRRTHTLTRDRTPEIGAAWDTPGKAFDQALEDFTDDELIVIERGLRRTTDVGTAQTARLRAD
ncbi:hypothetical protein [Streptomyces sp. NBC_00467]|uniref:hypothetical protein n=1 Tax=Streptomyces sp. NBC_00467 TaxID=2975752 RepID=UPI002E18539C